jgi:hypothetical protein
MLGATDLEQRTIVDIIGFGSIPFLALGITCISVYLLIGFASNDKTG